MNNVFVYCELEGTKVAEVSQELLTKGRKLANTLGVQLEAVAAGSGIVGKVESQILPYGVDKLHIFVHQLFPPCVFGKTAQIRKTSGWLLKAGPGASSA